MDQILILFGQGFCFKWCNLFLVTHNEELVLIHLSFWFWFWMQQMVSMVSCYFLSKDRHVQTNFQVQNIHQNIHWFHYTFKEESYFWQFSGVAGTHLLWWHAYFWIWILFFFDISKQEVHEQTWSSYIMS